MAGYIGQAPANKFLTLDKQTFTTSATDTYSLDRAVSSANEIELFLNNVRQEPIVAYTVSNSTLTLASAITSSDTMYCIYQGKAIGTVSPATNSVSNGMLVNSSVTVNGTSISLGASETITAGKIGQVVYTSSTGTVSSASTTFVDTNVSLAITPSSTSSKILFRASVNMFNIGNGICNANLRIVRDSTDLIDFDRVLYKESTAESSQVIIEYLDSPSTTSSTTYKIQTARGNGTETVVVNYGDSNGQGITSVTLMEVLA